MAKRKATSKGSVEVGPVLELIVAMTDQFCREQLNEEYAVLCRRLAEKLARKRPSPLLGGKPETWACGIIRTMLKIPQFDHHWTLPSRMDNSPMIWVVEVNGFMTDIRTCPRVFQEIAFEKGLIPYIPGERADDSTEE